MSARLKLALSYAGFLVFAGVLLLAVVWLFLLRYVPDGPLASSAGPFVPNRSDLWRAFSTPAMLAILALLAFGLIGGWFLAGRMLLAGLRPETSRTASTSKETQTSFANSPTPSTRCSIRLKRMWPNNSVSRPSSSALRPTHHMSCERH